MSKLLGDIETWFSERPIWLQEAAVRLIQNGKLTATDIEELVNLCKSEVNINPITIQPRCIPSGGLNYIENKVSLRLNSISNLSGINALSPRKPLKFSIEPMTIIYGRNGSGKSGYVRVLKNACGAKKPGKLLPNVFGGMNTKQSCTFNITDASTIKEINWNPALGVLDVLRAVEIYDCHCANVYVNEENEVAYEPWILSLFTLLTEICDKVGQALKEESNKLIPKIPKLPDKYVTTEVGNWYNKLNYTMNETDIDAKCLLTANIEDELLQIKKRLLEDNPADKAKKLRRIKSYAENIIKNAKIIEEKLNNEKCDMFLNSKADFLVKRKAADEDAKKVFEGAPLTGVGTETWKLLWESAREYSEKIAYPEIHFPNIGIDTKCVLCQQPLNEEAKKRFITFEEYVKGELENQAVTSENNLKGFLENFGNVPTSEQLNLQIDSADFINEIERSKIINHFDAIRKRINTLINAKEMAEIAPLPSEKELDFISERIDSVEQQILIYEEDAKKENRSELSNKMNELEAQKWLFQQKEIIKDEIQRLKLIKKYEDALRLTNTSQLSNEKSSLSDELITNEFIKRFNEELTELGASWIKVKIIKTKTSKGHVFHQIKIKDCPMDIHTADILSEGELRIVSLAAFLADVEGNPHNAPFIFDDPISSLDQDFEESTVIRLTKLCETRQVIVFTHRLSMLALLQDKLDKVNFKYEVICLRSENWGIGEPGDTLINEKNPAKALNSLQNERLAKAKKIFKEEGKAAYELFAKGICSDFRILLERLIEKELLADVVVRFRREINTKGKINKLAFINKEDCQIFDDLMSKYSKYEHSQSNEAPVTLPDPTELNADIIKLQTWLEEFRKRTE